MRQITLLNEKHAHKLKPQPEEEDTFVINPQSQPFHLPKVILLKNSLGSELTPEEQALRMKHLRFKFRMKQKLHGRHRRGIRSLDLLDPVQLEANMQALYTRVRSKRGRAALNRLESEYVRCKKQTQEDCMATFMRMYEMAKEITEKMDKMQEIIKGQIDSASHESHGFEPYAPAKKTKTTEAPPLEVTTPISSTEATQKPAKITRIKIKPSKISWIIDGHGHDEQDAYAENTPRVASTTGKPNATTVESTTVAVTTESGTTDSASNTSTTKSATSSSSWSALTTEEPDLDTIADNITWILDRFDKPKEIVPTTEGTLLKTTSRKQTTTGATTVTVRATTVIVTTDGPGFSSADLQGTTYSAVTSDLHTDRATTDAPLFTAADLQKTTLPSIDVHTDPHTQQSSTTTTELPAATTHSQDSSKATTELPTATTHSQESSKLTTELPIVPTTTELSTVAPETLTTTLPPENNTLPHKLMHESIQDTGTTAADSLNLLSTTTELVDTTTVITKLKPLKYSWIIDGSDDSSESNTTTQATTTKLNTESTTLPTTTQSNPDSTTLPTTTQATADSTTTTNQPLDTTHAVHPLDNPSSRENMLETSEEVHEKPSKEHSESTTVTGNESTTTKTTTSVEELKHHKESTTVEATTSVIDATTNQPKKDTTVEATTIAADPLPLHHNESSTTKATTPSVYDRTHWLQQFEQQASADQEELIETFGTDMDAMSLQQMGPKLNPVSGQTLNGE